MTPFKDGAVDYTSYERLVAHYIAAGVDGLFPLGTTGELPTLDEAEIEALVERTLAVAAGRVPVFVGVGGNATHKVDQGAEAAGAPAVRGHRLGLPLLQPAEPGRADRPLPRHRRRRPTATW